MAVMAANISLDQLINLGDFPKEYGDKKRSILIHLLHGVNPYRLARVANRFYQPLSRYNERIPEFLEMKR
jgi:hypothetical protein